MDVESLTKEELMFVNTIIGGPPSAIEVKVCVLCGAIVFDTERHYEHHQSVPLWRSYDSDPEPDQTVPLDYYSIDTTRHSEETLFKVQKALQNIGLGEKTITSAISSMQNEGILFREGIPSEE